MIKISHWYGRLGNNVQQCAVGHMVAEMLMTQFQSIDHEIIAKHQTSFGYNTQEASSKFFYWEGPYKEVNLPMEHIYKNMRRICKTYISPHLKIPRRDPIGDDTIVIHIRSGDVFDPGVVNPSQYTPNPYCFYDELIKEFEYAIVVTEPDSYNPIIDKLKENPKVTIQSSSVEEDFATLMAAKHLANSGVGTFAVAAALCSNNIENFWCTNLHLTEHLNWRMLLGSDVDVTLFELNNYIPVGEWKNTEDQRKMIMEWNFEDL